MLLLFPLVAGNFIGQVLMFVGLYVLMGMGLNLEVDFVIANTRGWAAVFTHPGMDRVCALGYGYVVPPGWVPGMVICAPEAGSPATGGEG